MIIKKGDKINNLTTKKMKEKKLTKEDSDIYQKIVKYGTMDDMFDFAYLVGRAYFAQEQLDEFKKLTTKK